ncbi:unnamed protein product [Clavelina lepadiformis]|uniref:t-SNARE coiled-coil homology domain-containing protein n=2 Tax=Clavelina lepadiformis TaxID=159417 RepID=A0ABP0FYA7_CLALP
MAQGRKLMMIRDRLPDLIRLHEEDPSLYHEPEYQEELPMEDETDLLLQRTGKSLKFLRELESMLKELKVHHREVVTCPSIFNANERRKKISSTTDRFQALARKTKSILHRMEMSDQDKLRYWPLSGSITGNHNDVTIRWQQSTSSVQMVSCPWMHPVGFVPVDVRMKFLLHSVLSLRLTQAVGGFYHEQSEYQKLCQRKVARQLSILGPIYPERGKLDGRLFNESTPLLYADIKDDAEVGREMRSKLNQVAHFENEILLLERKITQLSKAFLMMSSMVDEQGAMIDVIEQHVLMASDYVEVGNQRLKKAEKLKDKYRKKKFILICLLILLLAIVVVIIVVAVKNTQRHTVASPQSKVVIMKSQKT